MTAIKDLVDDTAKRKLNGTVEKTEKKKVDNLYTQLMEQYDIDVNSLAMLYCCSPRNIRAVAQGKEPWPKRTLTKKRRSHDEVRHILAQATKEQLARIRAVTFTEAQKVAQVYSQRPNAITAPTPRRVKAIKQFLQDYNMRIVTLANEMGYYVHANSTNTIGQAMGRGRISNAAWRRFLTIRARYKRQAEKAAPTEPTKPTKAPTKAPRVIVTETAPPVPPPPPAAETPHWTAWGKYVAALGLGATLWHLAHLVLR